HRGTALPGAGDSAQLLWRGRARRVHRARDLRRVHRPARRHAGPRSDPHLPVARRGVLPGGGVPAPRRHRGGTAMLVAESSGALAVTAAGLVAIAIAQACMGEESVSEAKTYTRAEHRAALRDAAAGPRA